jgi:hypothetical protein
MLLASAPTSRDHLLSIPAEYNVALEYSQISLRPDSLECQSQTLLSFKNDKARATEYVFVNEPLRKYYTAGDADWDCTEIFLTAT